GHGLTLWNRTRSRAEAIGVGKVAGTPAEAVKDADVVISILTNADAVRNAYLGESGAAKVARAQVFIEMSTAGPDVIKEVQLAAGAAAGVDPEDVFWVLTRFAPVLAARRAGFMEHKHEPVTFALRDAAKDIRLATDVYHRAGAFTPLADTTKDLYDRAAKTAGDLEMSAIVTVYERQTAGRKS